MFFIYLTELRLQCTKFIRKCENHRRFGISRKKVFVSIVDNFFQFESCLEGDVGELGFFASSCLRQYGKQQTYYDDKCVVKKYLFWHFSKFVVYFLEKYQLFFSNISFGPKNLDNISIQIIMGVRIRAFLAVITIITGISNCIAQLGMF